MGTWKLASSDHALTLDLNTSGAQNEVLSGTLVYEGKSYSVAGGWAASGSLPGRNASAFAVSGGTAIAVPDYLAATGIMIGLGDSPTRIEIQVDTSSSADGKFQHYKGVLLPA
ncbi:MAG TPA: hypothetical protein VKG25_19960 [Bryobacteraceae bacterium]|nr:hypothetical protein [Bryobacteraceae bacterium]